MVYSIEALSGSNAHQWEDYNNQSREGTLFHSLRWKKVLEDELTLKLKYYLILKDQRVVGIWPCMEQTAGFFRGLLGIPHSEYNNIILDDSFDINHINKILTLFSKEYSFLHLSTYNPDILDRVKYANFIVENTGNMVLDLTQKPPDTIWNRFSTNTRRSIRLFENKGFMAQEIDPQNDAELFYQHHVENLTHRKGEILPFAFLQRLLGSFSPNELRGVVLANSDAFAGGMLTFLHPAQKTVYFEYLVRNRSLPKRFTPTYFLFWNEINWAWNNGYEKVSFGRQSLDLNNPRFQNKVKFGAEHVPIHSRTVVFSKTTASLYRLKTYLSERRDAASI
jgi:hypothetical protein